MALLELGPRWRVGYGTMVLTSSCMNMSISQSEAKWNNELGRAALLGV